MPLNKLTKSFSIIIKHLQINPIVYLWLSLVTGSYKIACEKRKKKKKKIDFRIKWPNKSWFVIQPKCQITFSTRWGRFY